jgi:hypothetical protein
MRLQVVICSAGVKNSSATILVNTLAIVHERTASEGRPYNGMNAILSTVDPFNRRHPERRGAVLRRIATKCVCANSDVEILRLSLADGLRTTIYSGFH